MLSRQWCIFRHLKEHNMQRLGLNPDDKIYLGPGDFWFGQAPAHIHTILGSCIAITLWHPRLKIGGMCHYLLPRTEVRAPVGPQARTAGEAMALFLCAIRKHGTSPQNYQVKLFGGASFLMGRQDPNAQPNSVSVQNIVAAYQLLKRYGFSVMNESVGGNGSRRLVFDLATGDAWMSLNSR